MAKAAKTLTRVANWKKKKLLPIYADKIFNNTLLGETMVETSQALMGRGISMNLMVLTGDMKKQSVTVKFKVNRVENNKAVADLVGYYLSFASVKRFVRRGKDRIDLSFTGKTADYKTVRIKPILITKSSTTRAVLTSLRKNCFVLTTNFLKETKYNDVFNAVISNRLQKLLNDNLRKIYPLRTVEIRVLELEKTKATESSQVAKETEHVIQEQSLKESVEATSEPIEEVVSE